MEAVSLSRAKPLEELYEEVQSFDRVIVPDIPFGRALNRRLTRAQTGYFAVTPDQLVVGDRPGKADRLAFLDLVGETNQSWKQLAANIGEVLQCWEHRGSPTAILEYDRYDTAAIREVVDRIQTVDTRASRLSAYDLDQDLEIAVVGEQQLTTLQRSILPEDYTSISPFLQTDRDLPSVKLVESTTAITDLLLETVSRNDPGDIAVVIEEGSRYLTLVEAAFDAAGVAYYGGPGFTDDPDHRAMLRLLRLSHASRSVTVGDARPILSQFGVIPPIHPDGKRLEARPFPEANRVLELLETIPTGSVRGAIEIYERETEKELTTFTEELDRIGLLDAPADQRTIDDLTFYVHSFDIPFDRDDEGVTLASATGASYVDRPLVLFLGLDQGWARDMPPRPWIDRDRFFSRDLERFQLLIQSGTTHEFLVQDVANGQPVTPCIYLDACSDRSISRFADLTDVPPIRPFQRGASGFDLDIPTVTPSQFTTISQSSMNTFVHSPRDYAFSQLLESPESVPLEEGNLVHDFAEFAIANPSAIDTAVIEQAVDYMGSELAPFFDDGELALRKTTYHAWLTAIATYVDADPPHHLSVTIGEPSAGDNPFATLFDLPVTTANTERWFEDEPLGIKGKIDLVHSDTHLVDFKRSTRNTSGAVVRAAAVDPPDSNPTFQAPMYLAYLRSVVPDRHLRFSLLYLRELVEDALMGDIDLAEASTTIEYHPTSFPSFVRSVPAYESLVEESYSKSRKTFEQLDYETYRTFWDNLDHDLTDELDIEPVKAPLTEHLIEHVGDYKYVRTGAGQALRHLEGIRDSSFFNEDIDAFEAFVESQIDDLNRYLRGDTRFPVADLVEEPDDRRLNHKELLLEDA